MGTDVQNALSAEEKPLVENIVSLLQQLMSMQDAEAPEVIVEETEDEMPEVEKTADGDETGDSTAEERVAEVTPTTEESLQDLKKSINSLVSVVKGRTVNKTQNAKPDATTGFDTDCRAYEERC